MAKPLSAPYQTEGDNGFVGFISRQSAATIPPGYAQEIKNMRLERGMAQTRKGIARATDPALDGIYIADSCVFVGNDGIERIVLAADDGIYIYTPQQVLADEAWSALFEYPNNLRFWPQLGSTSLSISSYATSGDLTTITTGSAHGLEIGDWIRLVPDSTADPLFIGLFEVIAVPSSTQLVIVFSGHGVGPFATNPTLYPVTLWGTRFSSVVQANNAVYIFRGRTTDTAKTISAITYSSFAGIHTVTVTTSGNHGYVNGDEVTVSGITTAGYAGTYQITVGSATQFSYQVSPAPAAAPGVLGASPQALKQFAPLKWDGSTFSTAGMSVINPDSSTPASATAQPSDFAFYHQGRLVTAYQRDRVAVSDIFDPETYDLSLNNFRINTGSHDSLVGVAPWVSDQFLAFMRKSIYLCTVDTSSYAVGAAPGASSSIEVLTSEIGCVNRRSIAVAGQAVFFLSDRGVHVLTPQLDLKLISNTEPLSAPVDDIIQRINWRAVEGTCAAAFYDNRYYLALPVDDSKRCSHVLIYNLINKAWESLDELPAGLYVDNFLVCTVESQRRLVFTNREGGVFVYEYTTDDEVYALSGEPLLPVDLPFDLVGSGVTTVAVTGTLRTREYQLGTIEEKRFSKGQVAFVLEGSEEVSIAATAHDPDAEDDVDVATFDSGEESAVQRFRLGRRAASMDLTITTTAGRPKIRAVQVTAAPIGFDTRSES